MTADETRTRRAAHTRNTKDDVGTVKIQVVLTGSSGSRRTMHRRGNITRSWHVKLARVSDVAQAIEQVIFNWKEPLLRGSERADPE